MIFGIRILSMSALFGATICTILGGPADKQATGSDPDAMLAVRRKPYHPQVKPKKPRSWTKPYQGTPSPKCWRNSGSTSIFQVIAANHLTFDLTGLDNEEQYSAITEPVAIRERKRDSPVLSLQSRQPHEEPDEISNDLLAAYHFTCPHGGRITQLFMWGVEYVEGHPNVGMVRWHNVLDFSRTTLNLATYDWRSTWHSLWCMPVDKYECYYVATGDTYGRINRAQREISIELIMPEDGGDDIPEVTEFCGEIGHTPSLANGFSCIIELVQTFGQGHH